MNRPLPPLGKGAARGRGMLPTDFLPGGVRELFPGYVEIGPDFFAGFDLPVSAPFGELQFRDPRFHAPKDAAVSPSNSSLSSITAEMTADPLAMAGAMFFSDPSATLFDLLGRLDEIVLLASEAGTSSSSPLIFWAAIVVTLGLLGVSVREAGKRNIVDDFMEDHADALSRLHSALKDAGYGGDIRITLDRLVREGRTDEAEIIVNILLPVAERLGGAHAIEIFDRITDIDTNLIHPEFPGAISRLVRRCIDSGHLNSARFIISHLDDLTIISLDRHSDDTTLSAIDSSSFDHLIEYAGQNDIDMRELHGLVMLIISSLIDNISVDDGWILTDENKDSLQSHGRMVRQVIADAGERNRPLDPAYLLELSRVINYWLKETTLRTAESLTRTTSINEKDFRKYLEAYLRGDGLQLLGGWFDSYAATRNHEFSPPPESSPMDRMSEWDSGMPYVDMEWKFTSNPYSFKPQRVISTAGSL